MLEFIICELFDFLKLLRSAFCRLILFSHNQALLSNFTLIPDPKKNCFSFFYDKRLCSFRPGTYNLFKHNCNSFTEEVSNFLVGKGIPKYILDLPEEILQTYVLLTFTIRYLIYSYKYLFNLFRNDVLIRIIFIFRPIGQALGPLIETLSSNASAGFTVGQRFVEARIQREASPEYQLLNTAIEEARYISCNCRLSFFWFGYFIKISCTSAGWIPSR